MTLLVAAAVAAVVVLGLAVWVTWTAGRLDRLHARVDAAWAALDAQLVRRASAARAVAAALVDPALAAAAERALSAGPVDREAVENDLTRALRAVLPAGAPRLPPALREQLVGATAGIVLARAVHNTLVVDARALRTRRMPRLLHLAGHRAMPLPFDIAPDLDAALPGPLRPAALGRPGPPFAA